MKQSLLLLAVAAIFSTSADAADINVAVAANFTAPMKELAAMYEKETGNKILASYGATGAFYAQIKTVLLIRFFLPLMQKLQLRL